MRFQVLIINFTEQWLGAARLPQVLRKAGCRVHVFAPAGAYIAKSSYLDRHIDAPSDLAGFMDALKQHIEMEGSRYHWIFPADDPLLIALAERRQEPWVQSCLPVSAQGPQMDFLMSKFTFPLLCQEYGLPVPSTVMVQSADEALAAAARFGYPLIAKRRVGSAGDSVNFLPDTASLLALLDTLSPENPMAFQEFVSGQVGGSIALFDRGRLLCWVAFYKLKTYPGRFGPSTTLRFVDLPEYGPLLARLGEITGFHGISGADFIHDPETGRLILLEQHGRPMPQVYMGPSVGVDFSQAIREMLLGWTDTSASPVGNRSSKVIALFPQDICRSIAEDDPKSLVQWLYSPQWWQDITWREPKLLKSHLGLIRYTLRTRLRPAPQSRAPLGGSKTTELLPAVQEEPSLP